MLGRLQNCSKIGRGGAGMEARKGSIRIKLQRKAWTGQDGYKTAYFGWWWPVYNIIPVAVLSSHLRRLTSVGVVSALFMSRRSHTAHTLHGVLRRRSGDWPQPLDAVGRTQRRWLHVELLRPMMR